MGMRSPERVSVTRLATASRRVVSIAVDAGGWSGEGRRRLMIMEVEREVPSTRLRGGGSMMSMVKLRGSEAIVREGGFVGSEMRRVWRWWWDFLLRRSVLRSFWGVGVDGGGGCRFDW